jgi:hypothetical protein
LQAIDDVQITKGICPNKGSCDFETTTLCEYKNTPDAKINWIVTQANFATNFFGNIIFRINRSQILKSTS